MHLAQSNLTALSVVYWVRPCTEDREILTLRWMEVEDYFEKFLLPSAALFVGAVSLSMTNSHCRRCKYTIYLQNEWTLG